MSDLVQRLRKMNGNGFLTCGEAADRIEVLEAEILKWLDLGKRSADRIEALQARIDAIMPLLDESVERGNRIDVLEAALRIIAGYDPPVDKMMGDIELSRRALKGKS